MARRRAASRWLRHPRALPAAGSLAAFVMIAWATVAAVDVRNTMPAVREQSLMLQQLLSRIDHLDEEATAALRLAALTGETRWLDRYEAAEGEIAAMDATMAEVANALRPGWQDRLPPAPAGGAVGSIPALNVATAELIRLGAMDAALTLLDSPEYTLAKSAYEARKNAVLDELRTALDDAEVRTDRQLRWVSIAGASSFILLLGVWGVLVSAYQSRRQKALEDQLRQAQKLEAVGRLAGGVAHDFNNVLTAVLGHTELLLDRVPPSDEARHDAEEIQHHAERATRLTRQLLAFSRRQVLEPRVLDPGEVVARTESMLRRLIGDDIHLDVGIEGGLGRIEADPTQMEQVLINLAVNARDAMPDGGRLSLHAENVEITSARAASYPFDMEPGPYVRIRVADTGAGMDDATLSRIFEPFFTTKPTGQGTGLGLATVFGIVKQSGGFIHVESRPGAGTRFEILLPAVEDPLPDTAAPPPAPHRETGGRETILLVEDDDAVRTLVRRVLAGRGYTVLEAAGPAPALDELVPGHEGSIDLLLTDVIMPDMSGPELAEWLTAMRPGIRIIYMSGYAEEEIVRRGMATGPNRFLQKPFTPHDLTRCVREALDESTTAVTVPDSP